MIDRRSILRSLGLLLAAMSCAPSSRATPRDVAQEKADKVKAAYVLNFVKFTEWPAAAFSSDEAPLRIGVVGAGELEPLIRAIVGEEKIGARRVLVEPVNLASRRAEDLAVLRKYHAVFIGPGERDTFKQALAAVAGQPVLTISDLPQFAARGGMLGLVLAENRVTFDANPDAIRAANVSLSSKVLRLARIVKTRQE